MMPNKRNNLVGTLALILATLFWGMTFAFIKDAVASVNPFAFIFWRFLIACIVLYSLFHKKINFTRATLEHGILLGLFLAGIICFQTIGLVYTSAATAAFITAFSVVIVAILEPLFLKRWPILPLILAALLAVAGIGVITLENGITINQGDLWVLLCAFSSAAYILYASKASASGEAFSLTFIQSVFLLLVSGGVSLATAGITLPQHLNVWVAIIYCGIFGSFLAFFLQLRYQKYVSASKAANIFALEPIFGALTAALYLHERLSLKFFIGATLIFIAIVLSEKYSRHQVLPQA